MFDAIGVAALIDSSPERLTPTVMVSILGMPGSWGLLEVLNTIRSKWL